jgi:putative ABC transport system permease protein
MTALLSLAGLSYLRRHPAQGLLATLGIALGVGVVVAIDLAVGSADRAFQLSAAMVSGRASHQIVGGPNGLDETLFPRLRIAAGVRASAPLVEGFGRLPRFGDTTVRLLGIDPLSDTAVRSIGTGAAAMDTLRRLLTVPNGVLISARTAEHLHLKTGDTLRVLVKGRVQTLTVTTVTAPTRKIAARGLDEMLVMDIATAQALLDMQGRLSRIDVRLPDGAAGKAARQRIRRLLPPGAALLPASAMTANLAQMTRSFQFNLHAMSLLGLVVGMFLIYNAMSFSVVQRRPLWATLRALGVTRGGIFGVVLKEAALLGAAGIVLGIALGYVLGLGLVHVVLRTINDLYFTVAMSEPPVPSLVWVKGALLGGVASVSAAALPAWNAASLPVTRVLRRAAIETQTRRRLPRLALLGIVLLGAGASWLTAAGGDLAQAFAAIFMAVAGYALIIPLATRELMLLLHPAMSAIGLMGRMATRGVIVSLSRTGVAVAALTVVISVSLGMAIMIDSFRHTFSAWLNQTLQADFYVSAAGPSGTPLAPAAVNAIKSQPEVAAVSTGKRWYLDGPRAITEVFVLDPAPASKKGFRFKYGEPETAWQAFLHRNALLISESYATRHALKVGDTLVLRTERGEQRFPVAGVYYDYGSDQGVVAMSRGTYEHWWNDAGISSLGVYLKPGVDADAAAKKLRLAAGGKEMLSIRANRAVHDAALAVFDRTFAVTRVLQLLALLVAAAGIVGALAALQLERGRELGVLRSLGMTQLQLWGLVSGESLLMGLAAGLFALPLGLGLAYVLINVIQARAFGWTLQMSVAPAQPVQTMLLALAAAGAAGIYPAWRMARQSPLAVLREE